MKPGTALGTHTPGNTFWHRVPAGFKLLGLFATGILVVVARDLWVSLGTLALVAIALAWARTPAETLWRGARLLLLLGLFLFPYHIWNAGLTHAVAVVAGLFALVLAASLVTGTTSTDELLDTVTRGLGPFRRFGVSPEKVALTFSLVIRSIPLTSEIARETREAAKARGLERNLRALTTPLALRVVAQALLTGEALHARGVLDD